MKSDTDKKDLLKQYATLRQALLRLQLIPRADEATSAPAIDEATSAPAYDEQAPAAPAPAPALEETKEPPTEEVGNLTLD